jgi:hypothetical protein
MLNILKFLKLKIIRFFRISSNWVNRLPFAGKLSLRPVVLAVYTADKKTKKLKALGAFLLLSLFIVAHSSQVQLGVRGYSNHDLIPIKGFFLIYALANVLVTYTQCIIFSRLLVHLFRSKDKRSRHLSSGIFQEYRPSYALTCILVTLGGQVIFGLLY